jgi:hypothetical protein
MFETCSRGGVLAPSRADLITQAFYERLGVADVATWSNFNVNTLLPAIPANADVRKCGGDRDDN